MDYPELQSYARLLNSFHTPSAVSSGKQLHLLFLKRGALFSVLSIANRLLQMYVRCDSLRDAQFLFDEMPQRNYFAWNTLLEGYVKRGNKGNLLEFFYAMPQKDEFSWNVVVSGLMSLGACNEAQQVFDEMPWKKEIAWNMMIHGHVRNGRLREALILFKDFLKWKSCQGKGLMNWDPFILATAVRLCSATRRVELGKQIHAHLVLDNVNCDSVLASSLVDMYGKCGDLDVAKRLLVTMEKPDDYSLSSLISSLANASKMDEARRLFERKHNPCVVLWNTMISGYIINNEPVEALVLYNRMHKEGVKGDFSTFSAVLSACSCLCNRTICIELHLQALKLGIMSDLVVASAFIDAYSKCGSHGDASELFGELDTYDTVLLNSMTTVFLNCGRINEAKRIFSDTQPKSLISWNSMICGLSQNGYPMEALDLFCTMNDCNIWMDEFSLSSAISACASISLLDLGEQIFARATVIGLDNHQILASSLMDLYCKCGLVDHGRKLFDQLIDADSASWNSMLMGYAMNGHGDEALALFHLMKLKAVPPNEITFTAVLSACSHCGLVEEAKHWFWIMKNDYHVDPKVEHYSCVIDLLTRAGQLQEAVDLISNIPFPTDANMWSAILRGCIEHGNKSLAIIVVNKIIELDFRNSGAFVQLAAALASAGDWMESSSARQLMRDMKIHKSPGKSWC